MRVELRIDPACKDPHALLNVKKLSRSLQFAIEIMEKEGEEYFLTGLKDGKLYMIEPENIEIVRTEGRELLLYDKGKSRYSLQKPLYELERILGNSFVRISKSTILNIRSIDHVEASINGTMEVVMKNGIEDVITRSYRKIFKERLGV